MEPQHTESTAQKVLRDRLWSNRTELKTRKRWRPRWNDDRLKLGLGGHDGRRGQLRRLNTYRMYRLPLPARPERPSADRKEQQAANPRRQANAADPGPTLVPRSSSTISTAINPVWSDQVANRRACRFRLDGHRERRRSHLTRLT
jgi:hypothetical protein